VLLFTVTLTKPLLSQPERDDYDLFETEYDWLEIQDIGEPMVEIRDNDFRGPFRIGYPFPFCGEVYETFWISSNGFIGFGPPVEYGSFENQELPNEGIPNNIIALYWKNLDPDAFWADGMIYHGVRNDLRIIQYQGIGEHNQDGIEPDNTITMQVVLEPDGDIIFQYKEIGEDFDLNVGTIGIEGRNGLQGTTIRHNGEGVGLVNEIAYLLTEHGPGSFLIWDAGDITESGDAQEEALRALGHTVAHLRLEQGQELQPALNEFEAVFVNLGNFGNDGRNYHVLTGEEGAILAGYLEAGGAVYLEGSDTWFRDPATDAHPYFHIQGIHDGEGLDPPVTGLDGTFAERLVFEGYEAENNEFIDRLEAIDDAEAVFTFHDEEEEFVGMAAFWGDNYRTIGCSFEFGALIDGERGSKEELIDRMIEFFRAPPPEFPPPLNLTARVDDSEVTLSWDHPRRREQLMNVEILDLQREIARLSTPRNGRKPSPEGRAMIMELRRRLAKAAEQYEDVPQRDELTGFNIYVDGREFDFTNARSYTVFDLQNNVSYEFAVTALYENPNGESDPAGPISATPTAIIVPDWEQDFEGFNGALNPDPAQDAWEWGEPEMGAASGDRAWGTIIDQSYPDLANFYLYIPPIDFEEVERVWLTFNHFIDAESGWDGGQLQISTDENGERWEIITPLGGYPQADIFALNSTPGFSGTTEDWEPVIFELTDYVGQMIRIRFVFRSDESNFRPYAGWFIDDLALIVPEIGSLRVSVVDALNEDFLQDVRVELVGFQIAFTNNNGTVLFEDVPVGERQIISSLPGYLSDTTEVEIRAGEQENAEIELERWDSALTCDPEALVVELAFDERIERQLNLFNVEQSPTTFKVYIDYFIGQNQDRGFQGTSHRYQGPRRDEPWDLIRTYDLTEETGEQFFTGAHFVRDQGPLTYRLIASAGDFHSGECRFYQYDREGNFIEHVRQSDNRIEGWGLRDLAYDSRLVYGSQDNLIFRMNPITGGYNGTFRGAPLLVNRAIAYVPEDDAFWIGDWDDTWFKIARNGNILDRNSLHGLTGVVGMAWNPSDPDGAFLYVHNQESENGGGAIYRYNPETRELVRQLVTAQEDEGYAGGAFVTYLYDTHNYVLGALIQGPEGDFVKLYELWPHESWISITPTSGEIDGEENNEPGARELTVTFDAANLFDEVKTALIEIVDEMTLDVLTILCELTVVGGAASISGQVIIDDPDVHLPSVDITLNGENPTFPNAEGFFEYPRLSPGEYILRAALLEYEPFESDPFELEPDQNFEDFEIRMIPIRTGTVSGVVNSVYLDENENQEVLEGVEISVLRVEGERIFEIAATDENGEYFIDVPIGVYNIIAYRQGWGIITEEGVEVIENEVVEVNFVLDDRHHIRTMRTNDYHDDEIELFWLPPGSSGEDVSLSYHSGILANGIYLISHEDIIATRFEPEGTYDILELVIYTIRRGDEIGGNRGWPDGWMDDFLLMVFNEDPETGLPGELLYQRLMTDLLRNNANGWETLVVPDLRFQEGPFYIGWSHDPDGFNYDAVGLDDDYDHEGTSFIRLDNEWRPYEQIPGDQLVEALIWSHFEEEEELLAPHTRRLNENRNAGISGCEITPDDLTDAIVLLNPDHPGIELPPVNHNWKEIYRMVRSPMRDEMLGFMVYVDGEPALDSLLDSWVFNWRHHIGSENENREYTYSVSAFYPDIDDPEADPVELEGVEVVATANMSPGPVEDIAVQCDGLVYWVTWDEPLLNEDQSDCEDYAGCEIFVDGELAVVVEADVFSWRGEIEQGEEGWYNIRLVALDEVPNRAVSEEVDVPLGPAVVYDFENNRPVFRAEPAGGAWRWSLTMRNGPGTAHSGSYAWATAPFQGEYVDNADWRITTISDIDYYVESEAARMEFYQFMETETGHDGGQVLISVNDGDWQLIEPIDDGYPDQTVPGLRNTPGYTGVTGGWILATFDLSEYQDNIVRFRWRFGSDQSVHRYPGWYIDDLVLWGCSIPEYVTVIGRIVDQDNDPVVGAVITDGRRTAFSDLEGRYTLANILPGDINITITNPGYRGSVIMLNANPGDFIIADDLTLIQARIEAEPDELEFVLGGADVLEVELTITSQCNVELPYWIRIISSPEALRNERCPRVVRSIVDPAPNRDDPWDVAFEWNVTERTGYRRIMGAEFTGDHFYLSIADPERGTSIVVLDWQGNVERTFEQPVDVVGWGLRDLAWDGELLYGSQNRRIYGFNIEGELISEQAGAPVTVNRALAYDPASNGFWTAEWDSPWYLVNREGEVQFQWDEHGLIGVYGMAYHPDDVDGLNLYVLNLEADGSTSIYKANPGEGVIGQVFQLEGAPTGCFITSAWDADRWILGAVVGSGESQSMIGLELNRHIGWLSVDPFNGIIMPDMDEEVIVRVQVPAEAGEDDVYSGEITIWIYDAALVTIPFEAQIIDGFRHYPDPPVNENFHNITIESATYLGEPLPVGSEIAAITPDGDVGGVLRWVQAPGELRCYRADDNGFRQGDPFAFSVWIPANNEEYEPDFEFLNGPSLFRVGGETGIDLTVAVPNRQEIELDAGWNLVSIYIQPNDPLVADLLHEINEREHLVIVKDGFGRFWWPAQRFNGLEDWDILAGYQINVTEDESFIVIGERIPPDTPIALDRGWNTVSYLLAEVVDSRVVLEGILDDIIIAKDGTGLFLVPEHNFFGLDELCPGQGYKIKVSRAVELVYNPGAQGGDEIGLFESKLEGPAPTGSDMSLLISGIKGIPDGEEVEISVITEGDHRLIGFGHLDSTPFGVVIRGDDITTSQIDGAKDSEKWDINVRINGNDVPVETRVISGDLIYTSDDLTVLELLAQRIEIPTAFMIDRIYPNPFNASTSVRFGLPEPTLVSVVVRDIKGRKVIDIPDRQYTAGWHNIAIDAAGWSSGIYMLEISTAQEKNIRKMILMR